MGGGRDGSNLVTEVPASAHDKVDAYATHGHDDSVFLVSSYTDVSVLAHTPKGQAGQGISSLHLDAKTVCTHIILTPRLVVNALVNIFGFPGIVQKNYRANCGNLMNNILIS